MGLGLRDAQSAWQDYACNLSLTGGRKDAAAIQEILPGMAWMHLPIFCNTLRPGTIQRSCMGHARYCPGAIWPAFMHGKIRWGPGRFCVSFSQIRMLWRMAQWWMFDSYSDIRADAPMEISLLVYYCSHNYIKWPGIWIFSMRSCLYHENGLKWLKKHRWVNTLTGLIRMIINSFIPGTALVPFAEVTGMILSASQELRPNALSKLDGDMNYQAFFHARRCMSRLATQKCQRIEAICEMIRQISTLSYTGWSSCRYGLLEETAASGFAASPGWW